MPTDLFGRLIFNNQWTDTWEYVRQVSPKEGAPDELALISPNTDPLSLDLRCGRNATFGWSRPKTATVQAGDTMGFGAGEPKIQGSDRARMYHPGIGSAWLSRSESGDLDSYEGDGDWFKILQIVGRTEQSLDFAAENNKKLFDPYKSLWGTFNADSVGDPSPFRLSPFDIPPSE
jgi:AA9 family protein